MHKGFVENLYTVVSERPQLLLTDLRETAGAVCGDRRQPDYGWGRGGAIVDDVNQQGEVFPPLKKLKS